MTEIKNRHLPEQGEINRTKIEGYSLRSGAFYAWLKESGYTVSQVAVLTLTKKNLCTSSRQSNCSAENICGF